MHNPPKQTHHWIPYTVYFTDINRPGDPIPAMTWKFQVTKQDFTVYICKLLINITKPQLLISELIKRLKLNGTHVRQSGD